MVELTILLKVVLGIIALTVLLKARFRMKPKPTSGIAGPDCTRSGSLHLYDT